ncbi:hypothetical protein ACHAQH_009058 [Verticillium albo-atrum]
MLTILSIGLLAAFTWASRFPGPDVPSGRATGVVGLHSVTKLSRSVTDPTAITFRTSNGSDIVVHVPALASTEDNYYVTLEENNQSITHCGGSVYESVHTIAESPLLSDCEALLEYLDTDERRWFLDPREEYPKLFTIASTGSCAVKVQAYDKTYFGNGDGAAVLRRAFDLEFAVVDGRIEADGYKYCDKCYKDCDGFRTQTSIAWRVEDPNKPAPNDADVQKEEGRDVEESDNTTADKRARSIRNPKFKGLAVRDSGIKWVDHVLKSTDGKDVTFQVNPAVNPARMVADQDDTETNDMVGYVYTEETSTRCRTTTVWQRTDDQLAQTSDCSELVWVLANSAWYRYWLFSADDIRWCHQGYGTALVQLGTCVFSACPTANVGFGNEDIRRFTQSGLDKIAGADMMRVEGEAKIDTSGGSREILSRLRDIETLLEGQAQTLATLTSEANVRSHHAEMTGISPQSHASASASSYLHPLPTRPAYSPWQVEEAHPDIAALPPLTIPVKQKTSSNYLLSLPAMRSLVGEYPNDLFFQLESKNEMPPELCFDGHPTATTPLQIDPDMDNHLVSVFFSTAHHDHPILDEEESQSTSDTFLEYGIDSSIESALCLVVCAVGAAASVTPALQDLSTSPPGMQYMQHALPTLVAFSSWSFS